MRKLFLTSIIMICAINTFSQISKNWKGTLDVNGMKLNLVFHIQKELDVYKGTFDSPDQNAFGLPIDEVIIADTIVSFKMSMIGAKYSGILSSDKMKMTGTFEQQGNTFPLILKVDISGENSLVRPQTPKPPYPYFSKEVIIQNFEDSIKLAGTLTLPDTIQKHPVVILISGSGPQDRDETIFGHKPFLVLADYLTRKGIGVLRFDDRGIGKSTGKFQEPK
jgi:hypothetical protein